MHPAIKTMLRAVDDFHQSPLGKKLNHTFNVFEWLLTYAETHLDQAQFHQIMKWSLDEVRSFEPKAFEKWVKELGFSQPSPNYIASQYPVMIESIATKTPHFHQQILTEFVVKLLQGSFLKQDWGKDCIKYIIKQVLGELYNKSMKLGQSELKQVKNLAASLYNSIGYDKDNLPMELKADLGLTYPKDGAEIAWFMMFLAILGKGEGSGAFPFMTRAYQDLLNKVQNQMNTDGCSFFQSAFGDYTNQTHTIEKLWISLKNKDKVFLVKSLLYLRNNGTNIHDSYANEKISHYEPILQTPKLNPTISKEVNQFYQSGEYRFPRLDVDIDIRIAFLGIVSLLAAKDNEGIEPHEQAYVTDLQERLGLLCMDKERFKRAVKKGTVHLTSLIPSEFKIPILVELYLLSLVDRNQEKQEIEYLKTIWQNLGITKNDWLRTREFLTDLKAEVKANNTPITVPVGDRCNLAPDMPTGIGKELAIKLLHILVATTDTSNVALEYIDTCEEVWGLKYISDYYRIFATHTELYQSFFNHGVTFRPLNDILAYIPQKFQKALLYESLNIILQDGSICNREEVFIKSNLSNLLISDTDFFYVIYTLYIETGKFYDSKELSVA